MNPVEILMRAWTAAGYPPPTGPLVQMLERVAGPIHAAFVEGNADFIAAGWEIAEQDFPFAKEHERYHTMLAAYRDAARPS